MALVVAALVVVADQVSKAWVLHHQSRGPHHLFGPLGIDVGRNSGVAFSLLTGHSVVAFVLTGALCVVVVVCALRSATTPAAVVFGLLLGGGVSNELDRVVRRGSGGVVDFLTLPHWPTFNGADVAVSCGVVALVALVVLHRPLVTVRRGRP
ncbi:MAG TPA: signal peptidase II [Acidimicrobiales bacterium]|nr:signal peptidase II [Acidimicrobiales bacterium]